MNCEIECWPESQELFELPGFSDNCRLINGDKGIATYGSSAYLYDTDWRNNPSGSMYDDSVGIDMVFDDELTELGFL